MMSNAVEGLSYAIEPDAKAACQGYTDQVTLPPVGSHVRIVGTYVQDTFHAKWMEIHPVTTITSISSIDHIPRTTPPPLTHRRADFLILTITRLHSKHSSSPYYVLCS